MARLPRLTLPGHAHHVLQRGNNRQIVFRDSDDFEAMLALLSEYAERERVAIHAYVLMPDHFHLLATPETPNGLPAMMQAIGRRYVLGFNRRHHRSGTLWEGRYKTTLVQAETYLLPCMAYIDLNPVRASLTPTAAAYRWSSYGHYVGQRVDKRITAHSSYWQLGNTPFAREARYAELVNQGLQPHQQAALTDTVLKGWALGDANFMAELQKQTPRRVARGKAGRPISQPPSDSALQDK